MTDSTAGPYSRAVGENMRAARKRAGLSLTQLAEKCGKFSAPAARSWEAGERGVTMDRLKEYADAVGVPPASLLPAGPGDDEPLVLTEDMVDLFIAFGIALQAGRRSRYALLTENPGGDA